MTNGGTGPYYGKLLFINSGRGHRPSSLTLTDPAPPYNTFVLLNNFYALTHPSEPNYIAAVGGDFFGAGDDDFCECIYACYEILGLIGPPYDRPYPPEHLVGCRSPRGEEYLLGLL